MKNKSIKFVFSGYTNKIMLVDFDSKLNILNHIEKEINQSSFLASSDNIFCYDRTINPTIYMLSKTDLLTIDSIKINSDNITHLTYDNQNNYLYGCSYSGGTIFRIKVENNKFKKDSIITIREEDRQTLSRCHCVFLNNDNSVLGVVNIATDKLNFYKSNQESLTLYKTIVLPKKTGPRHAIYSKNGKYIYIMTEYSNQVIVVDYENECIVNSYNTLSMDVESYGATLVKSNNLLYCSNRGEEKIAIFQILNDEKLEYINSIPVFGKHSRHMIISNDGKYIITCNKNSNNICFINTSNYCLEKEIIFDNPSCAIEV